MKLSRRALLLSSVALLTLRAPASTAAWSIVQSGSSSILKGWNTLKIGGGGFSRGMDVANDGTMVTRIDVFGAYVWKTNTPNIGNDKAARPTGTWLPLWSPRVVSTSDPGYTEWVDNLWIDGSGGAWEARICHGDSSKIWVGIGGNVWKSTDGGNTLVSATTGGFANYFTQSNQNPNNQRSSGGPFMAVDPQNGNVCFVGSFGTTGLIYTHDGGANWTSVSSGSVPHTSSSGSPVAIQVVCDPSSSISGGIHQGWFAASDGNGIYYSGDAGSTWTALPTSSAPTSNSYHRIFCDQLGRLWVASWDGIYNYDNLWLYTQGTTPTNGTWSQPLSSVSQNERCQSIAVDPNNSNRIAICTDGGDPIFTTTGPGGTWTAPSTVGSNIRIANDVPWLQNTSEGFMSCGECMFDNSGNLWLSEGIGNWFTSTPANPTTWTSRTAGIESLLGTGISSSPSTLNPGCLISFWDRPIFQRKNTQLDIYPSNHGLNYDQAIVYGSSSDWSFNNPSFYGVMTDGLGTAASGYTTDGGGPTGANWELWPSAFVQSGNSGSVAVSTPLNAVYVQGKSDPWYTLDGGKTWHHIDLSSLGVTVTQMVLTAAASSGSTSFSVSATQGLADGLWVNNSTNGAYPSANYSSPITITNISGSTVTLSSASVANLNIGDVIGVQTDGNDGTPVITSGFNSSQEGPHSRLVVASRVTPGTFWMYNGGGGTGASSTIEGIFKSTDGGVTWSKVATNVFSATSSGNTGQMLLKCIAVSGADVLFFGSTDSGLLYRSTDGGGTWSSISGLTSVGCFGFGAPISAGSYPAIGVIGTYGGVASFHISTDGGSTFVTQPAISTVSFDFAVDCEGDKNIYGLWYFPMFNTGALYYGHS